MHKPVYRKQLYPTYLLFRLTKWYTAMVLVVSLQALHAQRTGKTAPRMLAYDYLQQNHFYEAKLAFTKAIQTDPKEPLNYRDLALILMREKNYPDAEKQVNAGLRIAPNNIDLKSVLAEIALEKGDKLNAIRQLNAIAGLDPKNAYAYNRLADVSSGDASPNAQKTWLLKAIAASPANIVPRLRLCEILADGAKADSSLYYLQSIKKLSPDFSTATAALYNKASAELQGGRTKTAAEYIRQFDNLMKTSAAYARNLQDIEGPVLPVGNVEFTTSQIVNKNARGRSAALQNIKFTDASKSLGLEFGSAASTKRSVVALSDYGSGGELYLYSGGAESHLLTGELGGFQETKVAEGIQHDGADLDAVFADYDNDGFPDLFIATTKGILVYKNQNDGTFRREKNNIGLAGSANGNKMLFADVDQDGDLDLFVSGKGQNKLYRNNGNGTFTEQASAMGLSGEPNGAEGMDFADIDADGDLDIATASKAGGIKLYSNLRHAKFNNVAAQAQITSPNYAGSVVALGDYNNDGLADMFVSGKSTGGGTLLKNINGSRFAEDASSKLISAALTGLDVQDAVFFDFDNDGHLDLLVAGIPQNASARAVQLFHNDTTKGFSNVTNMLPPSVPRAYAIRIGDFNLDGDEDIFLAGPNGVKLLRNDGGNQNHYLQVQLTGFSYGNSKNNRAGIGAQLELKAGDLYQLKTVKNSMVTFGVGMRNTLDAVRVIWPNGVPQVIADPSRNERIVEKELLKGSCPFLFAWDGEKYEFVKDMMWRSAMGMPVAIHGTDTTYAYADPSKEYLLLPGDKLKEKDGKYSIKITEELWETEYFDKVNLVAVDHPDSADVFADERFVAPPYPGKNVYVVTHKHLPVSAQDGNGNNVLSKINSYDFTYAASFSPGKYQGIAEDHDLVLDLGDSAEANNITLFLRGWVFPSDASINTAVTQSGDYPVNPPSLQVINNNGEWQTVIPNMGYPMGRDKMVVADLTGKFLTANDRRVRIRTNMQVYWDNIFFTTGSATAPVQMNDVRMAKASLGYHGYSATYHKGGPYGPEWLDYNNTTTGQKWRDLTGYYTRYGDVTPLLQHADDEYIITNAGDEISIDFDATQLPALPKGWKRDFLIYSEGWVKDGDLNTAHGQTVLPLPYHAMPGYPYNDKYGYPTDAEHLQYQHTYNTRKITTVDFVNALKVGGR